MKAHHIITVLLVVIAALTIPTLVKSAIESPFGKIAEALTEATKHAGEDAAGKVGSGKVGRN